MKFLFSEIGPKKMSKTVEVTLQPLQTFYENKFLQQLHISALLCCHSYAIQRIDQYGSIASARVMSG